MALEPPIRTLADLQRAVDALMKKNMFALDQLKEIQQLAAARGVALTIEVQREDGRTVSLTPPANAEAVPAQVVAAEHVAPPGVHFSAPPGVHFSLGPRVGDETRHEYYEHMHEMFARGYIDQQELDARLDAMLACHTKDELDYLVSDLPRLEPAAEPAAKEQKKKFTIDQPAGFMLAFASLFGAVVTGGLDNAVAIVMSMVFVAIAVVISVISVKFRK